MQVVLPDDLAAPRSQAYAKMPQGLCIHPRIHCERLRSDRMACNLHQAFNNPLLNANTLVIRVSLEGSQQPIETVKNYKQNQY